MSRIIQPRREAVANNIANPDNPQGLYTGTRTNEPPPKRLSDIRAEVEAVAGERLLQYTEMVPGNRARFEDAAKTLNLADKAEVPLRLVQVGFLEPLALAERLLHSDNPADRERAACELFWLGRRSMQVYVAPYEGLMQASVVQAARRTTQNAEQGRGRDWAKKYRELAGSSILEKPRNKGSKTEFCWRVALEDAPRTPLRLRAKTAKAVEKRIRQVEKEILEEREKS